MRTAQVKKSAKEFVDKYMGANDIAAVVHTSGRTDAAQEFTSNKALLQRRHRQVRGPPHALAHDRAARRVLPATLDAPERVSKAGHRNGAAAVDRSRRAQPDSEPTDFERGFRAVGVLDTLKITAEFLTSVRGRRKAVLFFSEGIDYPIHRLVRRPERQRRHPRHAGRHHDGGARQRELLHDRSARPGRHDQRVHGDGGRRRARAGRRCPQCARLARTRRSPASPAGPFNAQTDLMAELMLSQGSLRELAEQTGGIASVNTNSLTVAFDRIVEANSRYYVLGYYPPTHPRDGRFHKIEVQAQSGRACASRRAEGYGSPRGRTAEERKRDEEAKRAREARRPNADKTSAQLRDILTSPLQQSGLNFTVQAAPFKNTQKEASVALAIEIDGDRLQYCGAQREGHCREQDRAVVLRRERARQGAGGHAHGARSHAAARDARARQDVRRSGEPAHQPSAWTISPADRRARGRRRADRLGVLRPRGSRFPQREADAGRPAARIGRRASRRRASSPIRCSRRCCPPPATSRREFPQRDLLALYTEIYDNIASRQARHIDVAVRLLSESGTEVFAVRDELTNGGARAREAVGHLRLLQADCAEGHPTGRYVLRVEAQVRGNVGDAKPFARETLITVVP